MKLTITFIGKQKRYRKSISVRTLVSFTVLSSLFMLVSSRSTDSVSEDIARIKLAQAANEAGGAEVDALAASTRQQLQILAERLAEMDATVSQLDEKGKLIAAEFGMKAEDLDAFDPGSSPKNVENEPLMEQIAALQQTVSAKKQQLAMLESLVRGHHIHEQSQLSGRPIASGWLSSYYGMRADRSLEQETEIRYSHKESSASDKLRTVSLGNANIDYLLEKGTRSGFSINSFFRFKNCSYTSKSKRVTDSISSCRSVTFISTFVSML